MDEFHSCSNDSKKTWKTLQSFSSSPKTSHIDLNVNGVTVSNPREVANTFNEHFTTVNAIPRANTGQANHNNYTDKKFKFEAITEADVANALNTVVIHKAPGLDDIHPRLLRESIPFITQPLTYLFNMSIETGKMEAN